MFKKKKPEAVMTRDGFFVSLDAVRKLMGKVKKDYLEHREQEFNECLQEALNNGAQVNVRRAKKLFKLELKEFEGLFNAIDSVLESSEKETTTEDNRVK